MNNNALLIIDDEPLVLDALCEVLENDIKTVFTASNGREGIEKLENNPQICCVICDVRMPIMDGIQTIRTAREKGIETPFIFYTGYGDDAIMKQVAKYGVLDFLHKPKVDNLLRVVKRGISEGMRIRDKKDISNEDETYKEILDLLD